jgi:ubiquinone/menaquinone biosynthesis C-methylase UbiE
VFQNHPHRDYDRRAFLPVIVRHRRNDSEGKLSLTVLYLDVTSVTSVQPDGTFVCQLVTGNGPELIWDSYAFSYDRILTQLSFYNDAVERHVRALSKDGVSRVLDLGAGTGNVTVQLLRRGQRVTAVDRSHAMLEGLRQKVLGLDDPYVLILERSAEDLRPLRDAQFDAVTILLALFAMDRPQTALSEAIRVLKPGGTLVVTEPNARFSLKPLLEQAETELRNMGLFESLAADWERVQAVNQRIDPAASAKFTAEGIVKMLKARRFEDIREEESHLGLCTTVTARRRG